MKERPIIFSGEMAQAILDGRKTQTRRLIKGQKIFYGEAYLGSHYGASISSFFGRKGANVWYEDLHWSSPAKPYTIKCPYGIPGDRLWVRETWRASVIYDPYKPSEIVDVFSYIQRDNILESTSYKNQVGIHYEANGAVGIEYGRYRHARFMPRWASRIDLLIKNIRVERLQEITTCDIHAEGLRTGFDEHEAVCDLEEQFTKLWDSIYAKKGFGWNANPWVWVIEFIPGLSRISRTMGVRI